MNLCEPKNLKVSKASFRKSVSSSADTIDDDINVFGSCKRIKATNRLTTVHEERTFSDLISQDSSIK